MKFAVVTPTIGSGHLDQCVKSVQGQSYSDFQHYIFIDGSKYSDKVNSVIKDCSKISTVELSENIGKNWYGHRVYAACSYIVNADVICYLDEDNWLEPNHLESLYEVLSMGYSWAHSLRNIVKKSGEFFCRDDCESLGRHSVYFNDSVFHVDTSCYAVRKDVAVKISGAWYGQWGADRQFLSMLRKHFDDYATTGEYTLNYRLDGNENSVEGEFFATGNRAMNERYRGNFPWNSLTHKNPLDKKKEFVYNTVSD